METLGIMSIKDLAKLMNKSESTIRTWRLRGQIPKDCFKVIGSTVFVKAKEIREFLGK